MKRALLLNADWTPLHFVTDVKAIYLVLKERAEVIALADGQPSLWSESFTTPNITIALPATLRLFNRVNKKWKPPRFRKKVLFNRDNWQCQYCGVELTWESVSIDHVLPSSRGGQTSWHNCVASCKPCNRKKGDSTPEEASMHLHVKPALPKAMHFWDAMRSNSWHPDWNHFIVK